MIPIPDGFTVASAGGSADAPAAMVLYPPGGRDVGEVHYLERGGALRSVETLVAELIGGLPGLQVHAVLPPEPQLTAEGEHASFVCVEGQVAQWPLRLYLGMVFLDDFVSLLRVLCWKRNTLEPVARKLLFRCRLGLGVRPRRFLFESPPGWSAQKQEQLLLLYPPNHPADSTCITIFPATPQSAAPQSVYETWMHKEMQQGFLLAESIGPSPAASRYGLQGAHFHVAGRWHTDGKEVQPAPELVQRDLVILQAAPYLYMLRLDSANRQRRDECVPLFQQLISSVQPVPRPAVEDPMGHWAG